MDTKLIARLVELVRKTGDRVVVPDDTEAGKAVVIMDLDAYEELMGTATKELPTEAAAEIPLQQMFEPEPLVAPAESPEPIVAPAETDVVQQIRAIREEPDSGKAGQRESQSESAPPANLPVAASEDLTKGQDDAKIKREIGNWKTVGEVLPSPAPAKAPAAFGPAKEPVNQPAVQPAPAAPSQLEDEERFYLEPIE